MRASYSPEFKNYLASVDSALIQAGNNAHALAEQTGTRFIIAEKEVQDPKPLAKALPTSFQEKTLDENL